MPSFQEHMRKYEENKKLLVDGLLAENTEFYNWIVTVSFYAAVHLVEAELSKYDINSKGHVARNNNVDRFRNLQNIRLYYKTLYDKSRIARYEAVFMSKKKSEFALQCLSNIEKELHVNK